MFVDAPVCTASQITVVGASLEESVPILCHVSSDPPEINFEWTFSSSGEHFEVPSGHYTTIQQTTGGAHRKIIESNDTLIETYGRYMYIYKYVYRYICYGQDYINLYTAMGKKIDSIYDKFYIFKNKLIRKFFKHYKKLFLLAYIIILWNF